MLYKKVGGKVWKIGVGHKTVYEIDPWIFLQIEAQRAAARFEKASSQHEAAKEMVLLAEEGYIERGMPFDQAWQEMLNHSTTRVRV